MKELTQKQAKRYSKSNKKQKAKILDEFCSTLGINRNTAVQKFIRTRKSIYPVALKILKHRGGSKKKFTEIHNSLLKKVWELAGCICAENIHPNLEVYIDQLKKNGKLKNYANQTINESKRVSLGTLKKTAGKFSSCRVSRKNRNWDSKYRVIPIESDFKKYAKIGIGYVEIDYVEHRNTSLSGSYAITGTYVDIYSQWVTRSAELGKSERVVKLIDTANRKKFYHVIKKLHSDNFKSILNLLMKNEKEGVSRSRALTPKDNGHVEQKNGDKVRKLVGKHMYNTRAQIELLNRIYSKEDLITNFFTSSAKLIEKRYDESGRMLYKKYDKPKTPYQRLLDSRQLTSKEKIKLEELYKGLNLVKLREESNGLCQRLFKTVEVKNVTIY